MLQCSLHKIKNNHNYELEPIVNEVIRIFIIFAIIVFFSYSVFVDWLYWMYGVQVMKYEAFPLTRLYIYYLSVIFYGSMCEDCTEYINFLRWKVCKISNLWTSYEYWRIVICNFRHKVPILSHPHVEWWVHMKWMGMYFALIVLHVGNKQ